MNPVSSLFSEDVEKKLERILKLIRRRNRAKKEPELVALVEDFHRHYQSLYGLYDQLRQASFETTDDGKGNENYSHSASGSESEYYSSDDIEINSDMAVYNNRSLHRRMSDNMKEELEKACAEVAELKHQLASKIEEKEALASDHLVALSKIQEIETINSNLRKEVDEKEQRVSALENVYKEPVTELEEQLTGLKTELESLQHQKRDLEAQLDDQGSETKQHGETNKALYAQISELELIEKLDGDEVTKLMKQIKDKENSLMSKIEESVARVGNLKKQVDYLRAQKCEDRGSIACKNNESFDQENVIPQELESLRSQKTEFEILLEKKSEEISQYLIQVDNLKGELARKSAREQLMVEEKESLLVQLTDLESQVDTLQRQEKISEDEVRCKIHEISQLREEKDALQAQILELETLLQERGLELSALRDDSESNRIKETATIVTLNAEIERLQKELDTLKKEKSQLELQIADQQRIMKEREESVNKPVEDSNPQPLKRWSSVTKSNIQVLEKKMEDLAEEFRKKIEDNIRILLQRIKVAEKIHFENKETHKIIKERLEVENAALEEKLAMYEAEFRKLTDTLDPGNSLTCMSNVTDEVGSEIDCETGSECDMKQLNSNNMGFLVAELDKQNEALLKEKISELECKLSEEGEEKLRQIKAVNEVEKRMGKLDKIMKQKDDILSSLQEEKREAIRQLRLLIDCKTAPEGDIKQLNGNVGSVVAKLDKQNEKLSSKKVSDSKSKLGEEGKEKLRLIELVNEVEKRVGELEKIKTEKDETLLSLQEEKREAIRQLCLLIDYHRCRCDHLKEIISKLTVSSKKKT
ncbi:hypothetical protein CCACVL1_13492 [Corchorus capsularis]|uniref:NAB domain-containing protein n=1 Tax=Corchorus capsularis TaxID=210143 RepID=A0A1R3IAR9_COCAP|nr:hypothetical protein CCACVL1_13492 [Corchorus capsularis]